MKRILLIFLVFLTCNTNFAQSSINVVTAPLDFDIVDIRPEFPGGYNAFIKYVINNFKMPDVEDLSGTIKVSMIIGSNGVVKDIKILNDLGSGTGEQILNILKECPKWVPGQHNGKPTNVLYKFPITIRTE
jgi:hypothetical protein